ncbi:MAG: AraC family transcriptional regulator [Verrucomicrobiota bacterium]
MKMELLTVGHYFQQPGCHPRPTPVPKKHRRIELVTGGRGWVAIKDQFIEVTCGALLWHQPGDLTIERSDFKDPYKCLSVNIACSFHPKVLAPRLTWWNDADEVNRFTREVVRLHARSSLSATTLLTYMLSRLQFQAELYILQRKHQQYPVELQEALNHIDAHYQTSLSLPDLAQASGWSIPHLHARFRELIGDSPHQVLLKRRIEASRELLAGTNDPIKSIAHDCGFSSASAFCSQFKRLTQLSPLEYRKQQVV